MGWDWGGAGSGAISGAGTGAMFGPWGAAIGGVGGGLLGGLTSGKGGNKDPQIENFYQAATPSTNNPLGGQSWSKDPNGNWVSNYGFSGPAQGVWNNLMGGMNKSSQMDPSQAGNAAFDRVYGSFQSRLDPMWDQRQKAFNAQMANSGLDAGSQAFGDASRQFNVGRNDAYNSAIGQAVGLGQQEQAQARQNSMLPFMQAQSMMGMLDQQGHNLNAPLVAAGMTQKANDNAADRAASKSQGKKGGAGSMLGGAGGKKGGGGGAKPSNDYLDGFSGADFSPGGSHEGWT